MKKLYYSLLLLCCFSLMSAEKTFAVDPYDNVALPQGWWLSVYPAYYEAEKLTDKNGNTTNGNLASKIYQGSLRATYYSKATLPNTWGLTIALPVGKKELLGDSDSGIGDLSIAAGYWVIDDPASKTYLVAGMYVDFPTGEFDKTKKVNMGSNVYKYRPAIGFAKTFNRFHTEGSLKYNIYTENEDTDIKAGDETIFEGYAGYFVRPDLLLGGLFNATSGKDKSFKGNEINDSGIRRYQAGPSVYFRPWKVFSVTVDALREFETRNTSEGYLIMSRFCWRM